MRNEKTGCVVSFVAATGLTIYDMCKAVDRGMTITDIRLIKKRVARAGPFERE
jgi:cyclic pyranopterin phosphate synthase